MLLERHMKEVLLASHGATVPYHRTRATLKDRVRILIDGGTIQSDADHDGTASVPAAPAGEIRDTLLEQQRLMEILFTKADAFLLNKPNDDTSATAREELLVDNAALLRVSNDVVTLLTRHSEHNVQTLIRWEVAVVLLVIAAATLGIWRFVQADLALKRSQAMTLHALHQRDVVKSALLSSVSHELRTPLTAIKTMLFSLHDEASLPPSVRHEFLMSIDRELEYLNGLVGNLLDMSRIEAGTLTPRRELHVLDELVEGAIRRVEVLLAGRPLHVHLAQNLPPISVDGMQIQQVLVNLLDNAIKFSSPSSPIRLTAALTGEFLEMRVSNIGEGVPADELERIFDRFYRVQSGRLSGTPGTGLGLAICRGIVEAHGGSIRAQSIPGKEMTILLRIPLATPADDRMSAASTALQRTS
jgi:two-component system sensor histidine kinase KdpD